MTRQQISKIILSRVAQLDARLDRGQISDEEWFRATSALSSMAVLWLKTASDVGTGGDGAP
jgi:hypothetical protein